jgi:RNAse (barnase) inhibitor barstar
LRGELEQANRFYDTLHREFQLEKQKVRGLEGLRNELVGRVADLEGQMGAVWDAVGQLRQFRGQDLDNAVNREVLISSGEGTEDSPYELDDSDSSSSGTREAVPAQMVGPVVIIPGQELPVPPPYRRTPPRRLRRTSRRGSTPYSRYLSPPVAGPSRLVPEVEADEGTVADSEPETDQSYARSSPVA